MRRIVAICTLSLLTGGCTETDPPRPARRESTRELGTPATIGNGGDVVRIRVPLRDIAPAPFAATLDGPGLRALASTDDGGAMFARSVQGHIVTGVLDARGTLVGGPFDAGAVQFDVRDLSLAVRGRDALVAWTSARGEGFERIDLQRIRRDGTRVGDPIPLGAFAVATVVDGGGPDTLGRFVRVAVDPSGWLVAMRGPAIRCNGRECHTVRVVHVDAAFDDLVPRVSLDDPMLDGPVALVSSQTAGWNVLVSRGADTTWMQGPGPFARLVATPFRAPRVAAWMDASGEPGALLAAPPAHRTASAGWLVTASGTTAVTAPGLRCEGDVPVVDLVESSTPHTHHRVRVADPGGEALALVAVNGSQPVAGHAPTEALVATRAGTLLWSRDGIELRACTATESP